MNDIETIIRKMTLKEKVALCTGATFWTTKDYPEHGIPALFLSDGPLGLRKQGLTGDMLGVNNSSPSTCFPAEVTTGQSWNPELTQRIGKAIAEEARDQSVDVVLGPGANLKRNPLCGRNFEYFSEDPYHAGKMAAGFIKGAEGMGVGTSLKHFAANSQEQCRFTSDSIMDERTLREVYLTAFEIAVKEGYPSTVMCAYPKLNGVHCSDNKQLLTDILRTEWGFDGMVVTDWGAMNDRIEGFKAGCDLNMPGGSNYMEKDVLKAVEEGTLSEEDVDASVRRILHLCAKALETRKTSVSCDYDAHHALSREAAEQGAVLLKNENNILPLQKGTKIAVIGAMAKEMRYQGAGSSHIHPTKVSHPLEYLPDAVYAPGCDARGDTTDALLIQAVEAAKGAETAVIFAGLPDRFESEGFDRPNLQMPEGHIEMIEAVSAANPNTVVVLLCGCVVECPWADKVKAILYMGLPGQAGGEAVANLLYGAVCPGGKLTESWPLTYDAVPSSACYCKTDDALYEEGIYVGYRYYDKAGVPVRWPFGYGLSYTTFAYSDLTVQDRTVSVTVTNTGKVTGAEVVQLFVHAPQEGLHRPVRELKGFRRILLQPGDSETVTFELDDRSFALWQDGWVVPGGVYTVEVDNLSADISIPGEALPAPSWQSGSFYDKCAGKPSLKGWEIMLGKAYNPPVYEKHKYTMENTIMQMKEHSLFAKIMYKAVEMTIAKDFDGKADYENPDFRMIMASSAGAPLRSMQISGGIPDGILQGVLEIINGHFFRGIGKMIRR